MRILFLFPLLLTTSIVTFAQELARVDPAHGAEDEVRRVQDALIDAYVHRDIDALDRILADEYTFINDDATVVNKRQTLDSFKSGDRQISSYKRQDDSVRLYGDTAVMTYRYQSKETYKGRDDSSDDLLTRIFVKRDGRWQMVGGQETRAVGSEPSARDRLIGTWRLVSAEALRPDGSLQPFPEFGSHPIGYLMYDKTGHMCVTLANPNPPHWADPAKPSDIERAMSHRAMEAYCGTYEVREKEGRVIHRPELAEWPYYIGSDQVRNFHIEGDRLILSLEETIPNGERRRSRITWERVSAESLPSIKTTSAAVFGSDRTQDDADIYKRLIGSWRQVSDEEILPDGTVVRPDEVGLITYDASGHMSAQVMRRSVSGAQVPSDAIYLNNGYDAYFGTYTIDEVKHTITHHVEGSVARQLMGKDLVRSFKFEGQQLILTPVAPNEHWTVVLEKNTGY